MRSRKCFTVDDANRMCAHGHFHHNKISMEQASHLTALALVPASNSQLFYTAQSIRKKHDRNVDKWPPHINVLYPFVKPDEIKMAAASLRGVVSSAKIDKISLNFQRLGHFGHRIVFLEPSQKSALMELHKICTDSFPMFTPLQPKKGSQFSPHMTVGQFTKSTAQEFLATHSFLPCHYVFRELVVLTRETTKDPMRVHTRIPLSPNALDKCNPDIGAFMTNGCFPLETEPEARLLVHSEKPGRLLEVRLPLAQHFVHGELPRPVSKNRLLIFVVDNSGSMCGSPWRQVQETISGFLLGPTDTTTRTEVILYNSKAAWLDSAQAADAIKASKAGGRTSFVAAFAKITEVLNTVNVDHRATEISVVFMTDGDDTCHQKIAKARTAFAKDLRQVPFAKRVVVHTIGFTKEHDYAFLDLLRRAGTEDGFFRYAERSAEGGSLAEKFADLFNWFQTSNQKIKVSFELPEGLTLHQATGTTDNATVKDGLFTAEVALNDRECLEFEVWLRPRKAVDPSADAGSSVKICGKHTVDHAGSECNMHIRVEITQGGESKPASTVIKARMNTVPQTSRVQQASFQFRLLELQVSQCANRLFKLSTSKDSAAIDELTDQVQGCQRELKSVCVFGRDGICNALKGHANGVSKRREILEKRIDLQSQLDTILRALADTRRAQLTRAGKDRIQTATLARANDIRFAAKFRQSRRQRAMDLRVAKNAKLNSTVSWAQECRISDLKALAKAIPKEAQDLFFCTMSQTNVLEMLSLPIQGDAVGAEEVDVMGFGVDVVSRPEFAAVDCPTLIHVDVPGSTFLTRSSMQENSGDYGFLIASTNTTSTVAPPRFLPLIQDAIKFGIKVSGPVAAHGGYASFQQSQQVTSAVCGRAREPINAWMPLYICEAHWKRVRLHLPSILGYFCTLDPLGYDSAQRMVPLTILGGMITSLGPQKCSDRDLQLLFAFMRTCIAIVEDEAGHMDKLEKYVADAVTSPRGRLKDKAPNILTLIGALAVLPHESVARVMGLTTEASPAAASGKIESKVPKATGADEVKDDDATESVTYEEVVFESPVEAVESKGLTAAEATAEAEKSKTKCESRWTQLWLGLVAETLRRGYCAAQHDMTPAEEMDMVGQILNTPGPDVLATGARSILAALTGTATDPATTAAKSGTGDVTDKPDSSLQEAPSWRDARLPRMDKRVREAFGMLGLESADRIPGGTKAASVAACRRRVRDWTDKALTEVDSEGRSVLKRMVFNFFPDEASAAAASKATPNMTKVTRQNLVVAGKALRTAAQKTGTKPRHIQTAAAFFDCWWSVEREFKTTLDNRGGVAPSEWLITVRKALTTGVIQKTNSQTKRQGNLFKCLLNMPRIKMDCAQMAQYCQVMSVQTVMGRRNKAARSMLASNAYFDIGAPNAVDAFKQHWRTEFQRQSLSQREKLQLQALARRNIRYMAQTRDIWCFIGLLNHTVQERNGREWTELLLLFQHKVGAMPAEIPLRKEKLTVMLSGRLFDDEDSAYSTSTRVFAKGNRMLPSTALRDQLIACFEDKNDYFQIETRLRGKCGYMYRSSNIPNRHGHSNENPSEWAMNQ